MNRKEEIRTRRMVLLAGVLNSGIKAGLDHVFVSDLHDMFQDEAAGSELGFKYVDAFRQFVEKIVPVTVGKMKRRLRAYVPLSMDVSRFIFEQTGIDAQIDVELVSEVNAAWHVEEFQPVGDPIFHSSMNHGGQS